MDPTIIENVKQALSSIKHSQNPIPSTRACEFCTNVSMLLNDWQYGKSAKVKNWIQIYDIQEKQAIFDQCSFGLNIMKSSVCIGLTMKSVDYLTGGLPIINTIGGDTEHLINSRNIGIPLLREQPEETANQILSLTDSQLLQMRENALSCFRDYFSEDIFRQNLLNILQGDRL